MKEYKIHIAEIIADATGLDSDSIQSVMEFPPSEEMGDIAFPCYMLAKSMRKAPPIIAGELSAKFDTDDLIEKIEPKGPYINFFINKSHLINNVISEISTKNQNYGKDTIGAGKTVIIEYSSPNIAKPFGIGHLRSTVIGAALRNIHRHLGYNVVGINHLGDWGTQFGKLVYAFKKWGDETKLKDDPIGHLYELYVRIHQEEEKDPALVEKTRAEFKNLEESKPENIALWKLFSEFSKSEFTRIYQMLGVEFDSEIGESFYVDKMKAVENDLEEASLLKESQDATIVDLEEYDMPPMLVRKSDDSSLYSTRDLAAAIYRKKTYDFHKMYYVVNVAQSLYFKQLFKVLDLLGNKWSTDCNHVSFGWVKFGEEMMSTRRGNIVVLEDVIKKTIEKTKDIIKENSPDLPDPDKVAYDVGVGAVIFADLAYRRETDIAFDWDRMLDFRGHSGPYIQYTHARICSVIKKFDNEIPVNSDTSILKLPEEFTMSKLLLSYPDILKKAAEESEPFYISSFLLELCAIFNTYYQKYRSPEDRILSTDKEMAAARVSLVNCAKQTLHSGLKILGINSPEMM